MTESKLYTLRMLARRYRPHGLSIAWLRAEADAGRLPCLRAGRRRLFDIEAVEEALLERAARRQPAPEVPIASTVGGAL